MARTTRRRTTPEYVDLGGVAEMVGVTRGSAQTYHTRATAHRRDGNPRPGDLPEPDDVFGQTPVWLRSTILRWLDTRPGRGAGGGRPWAAKDQTASAS